jgi:hypothetical protein
MRQLLKNTFTLAVALVFTAGMAFGQQHTADIEQSGGSTADIEQITQSQTVEGIDGGSQLRPNGNALTQEFGSDLTVYQFTGASGNRPGNLLQAEQEDGTQSMTVWQSGVDHEALIDQYGGSGNVAALEQGGSNADADIVQNGSGNVVDNAFESPRSRRVSGFQNRFKGSKQGSGSVANVEQTGQGNQLYFQQSSDETLQLKQTGGSYAEILQEGGMNTVAQNKDGSGIFNSLNGSDLYIQQNGGGNSVYGSQTTAGSSTGLILQSGGSNSVKLVQQ